MQAVLSVSSELVAWTNSDLPIACWIFIIA